MAPRYITAALVAWMLLSAMPDVGAAPESKTSKSKQVVGGFWTGHIGGKPIQMNLTRHRSKNPLSPSLSGEYWYDSVNTSNTLHLSGNIDANFRFNLREEELQQPNTGRPGKEVITGQFQGAFDKSFASAQGTWTNANGTKSLPFRISRIVQYAEERRVTKAQELTIRYPTFNWIINHKSIYKELWNCSDDLQKCSNSIEIRSYSDNHVSLLFTFWEYGGGAHGSWTYASMALQKSKGGDGTYQRLSLGDLVDATPQCAEKLTNTLAQVSREYELDFSGFSFSSQEMAAGGYAFTLHRHGLTMHFGPYVLAPYAEGGFNVFLPFKKISSCVKANSLQAVFPDYGS